MHAEWIVLLPHARDNSAKWVDEYLLGVDRHFTTGFFTDAFGRNFRIFPQLNVNDASFVGRHRFKDLSSACADSLVCHPTGDLAQLLFTPVTVAFNVDDQGD
jgi:hypothetical protein